MVCLQQSLGVFFLKKRKSNIELLRIVMILMVILNHYLNGDMGGLLSRAVLNCRFMAV